MNLVRSIAISAILMFALASLAQQNAAKPDGNGQMQVEEHLKVLTAKLDLTSEQQEKIKPILQTLHNETQKLVSDKNLSRDERLARIRPQREAADKKIREVLNPAQAQKLDELERQPHPELHENLSGASAPSPQLR
jgi:Spy/CpxP family protein refolding chaperone